MNRLPVPYPLNGRWTYLAVIAGLSVVFFVCWQVHQQRETAWKVTHGKTGTDTTGGGEQEKGRPNSTDEICSYWRRHQGHLKRLLTVDYPAALARRYAAMPDADSVGAFGKSYIDHYYEKHPGQGRHVEELKRAHPADLRSAERQMADLRKCLIYGCSIGDTTPVNDHLTVSDLANLVLAEPAYLTDVRTLTAQVERQVYSDEKVARQVESMQLSTELSSFLQTAAARYAETNRQITEAAGYDAEAYDYTTAEDYSIGIFNFASIYKGKTESELWQITDAYNKEYDAMDVQALAESSRDDEESRRLLTELKDLQVLRQATIGSRWAGRDGRSP